MPTTNCPCIESGTIDGWIGNWAASHSAIMGTIVGAEVGITYHPVGVLRRGYEIFDTTAIPGGATIISVIHNAWLVGFGGGNFKVWVLKSIVPGLHPSNPIAPNDWDYALYDIAGAYMMTGAGDWSLHDADLMYWGYPIPTNFIIPGANSPLCFMQGFSDTPGMGGGDYENVGPAAYEGGYWFGRATHQAYLTVDWTTAGPPVYGGGINRRNRDSKRY